MSDILVFGSIQLEKYGRGVIWTDSLTGYYVMYVNFQIRIYKTSNSGQTWSLLTSFAGGTGLSISIWYDKWTPGDSGTLLHIAYWGYTSPGTTWDGLRYYTWDTSNDTIGGPVVINTVDAQSGGVTRNEICKSINGYLYIASTWNRTAAGGGTVAYFYKSIDNGSTWTNKTTFQESTGNDPSDYYRLTPTQAGVVASYIDVSTDEFTQKTYDETGDTWSESPAIDSGFALTGTEVYIPLQSVLRHSDQHIITALSTIQNSNSGDIRVYDNSTQKSEPISNTKTVGVGLTIDQNNNFIYLFYGDATISTSDMAVYYKRSVSGGASWGTSIQINATNGAFHNVLSDISTYNGRLEPAFIDATLDDAYVNYDNSFALPTSTGYRIVSLSIQITPYSPIKDGWDAIVILNLTPADRPLDPYSTFRTINPNSPSSVIPTAFAKPRPRTS